MARPKPEESKGGAPEWMNTYGDLVTLLLCFFVLMYAMSNVDTTKFATMAASFSGADSTFVDLGGGNGISDLLGSGIMQLPDIDKSILDSLQDKESDSETSEEFEKLASDLETYFATDTKVEVDVDFTVEEIKLTLGEDLLFDSGKAIVKEGAFRVIDIIVDQLTSFQDYNILVEGHTDNVKMNSAQFPDNWYLSSARAIEVGRCLEVRGIVPMRITAVGHGEYWPRADNSTPEGRAINRRVEITIAKKSK